MSDLKLAITLAPGIEADDVITDINAAILCSLEEDSKKITGWSWNR